MKAEMAQKQTSMPQGAIASRPPTLQTRAARHRERQHCATDNRITLPRWLVYALFTAYCLAMWAGAIWLVRLIF